MIILENINSKFKNLLENQYYVRVIKSPERFIGKMPHRLTTKEQAIICKSLEDAKKLRKRFAIRNNFSTSDFEIVTGLDLYKAENPDEEIITEANGDEELDIYRGILADNKKEADRYIRSTKKFGAQDFGKGMYWTQSEEVAKNYGNYIYKDTITRDMAKKILDAQDIVLLSDEMHKSLTPKLVAQLDLGPGAKYTFYPKLWKDLDMVKQIQSRYKDYIKKTNGILLDNIDEKIKNNKI